jgi:large subunit ribosomal protein L1
MPNPKAGLVVPPKANLEPLVERLRRTVRARAKTHLSVQTLVGKENQNEDELVENILTVYNAVAHKLPREENNIKNAQLKLTMSKPVMI